jgi:ABC-2 type transport system permease protein
MLGSALDVPAWTLDLTPFHHIALMPVQSFKTGPALIMCAIGIAGVAAALPLFRRRDIVGA